MSAAVHNNNDDGARDDLEGVLVEAGAMDAAHLAEFEEEEEESEDDDNEEEDEDEMVEADDPRRMEITDLERQRALRIRDAIRSQPELDPVSDFMCVQLAIICEDNIHQAVQRAHGMQAYREAYRILDTFDDACRRIVQMLKLFPQRVISFSFCPQEDRYVYAYDLSKLKFSNLRSEEDFASYFAGSLYMHVAMSAEFASVRTGMMAMIECTNADWSSKPDFKVLTRLFGELHHSYPFRGHAHLYHTGSVINVMVSLLRKVLPDHIRDKFRAGYRFEEPLDKLFLQPDVQTAEARVTFEIIAALRRHYDNVKAFSLDDPGPNDVPLPLPTTNPS